LAPPKIPGTALPEIIKKTNPSNPIEHFIPFVGQALVFSTFEPMNPVAGVIGGGSFGEIYEGIGPKNKKVCKFFSQFFIIMTIFNFIFMNKLY
jgi:hypothetical protein